MDRQEKVIREHFDIGTKRDLIVTDEITMHMHIKGIVVEFTTSLNEDGTVNVEYELVEIRNNSYVSRNVNLVPRAQND